MNWFTPLKSKGKLLPFPRDPRQLIPNALRHSALVISPFRHESDDCMEHDEVRQAGRVSNHEPMDLFKFLYVGRDGSNRVPDCQITGTAEAFGCKAGTSRQIDRRQMPQTSEALATVAAQMAEEAPVLRAGDKEANPPAEPEVGGFVKTKRAEFADVACRCPLDEMNDPRIQNTVVNFIEGFFRATKEPEKVAGHSALNSLKWNASLGCTNLSEFAGGLSSPQYLVAYRQEIRGTDAEKEFLHRQSMSGGQPNEPKTELLIVSEVRMPRQNLLQSSATNLPKQAMRSNSKHVMRWQSLQKRKRARCSGIAGERVLPGLSSPIGCAIVDCYGSLG